MTLVVSFWQQPQIELAGESVIRCHENKSISTYVYFLPPPDPPQHLLALCVCVTLLPSS